MKYNTNLIYMLAIASIVCVCCGDACPGKTKLASRFPPSARLLLTHRSIMKTNINLSFVRLEVFTLLCEVYNYLN